MRTRFQKQKYINSRNTEKTADAQTRRLQLQLLEPTPRPKILSLWTAIRLDSSQQDQSLLVTAGRRWELPWAWAPWGSAHGCQQDRRGLTPQLLRFLNMSFLPAGWLSGVGRPALVQRHTKRILLEFSQPPANRPRDSASVGCHGCLGGGGGSGSLLLWADRHSRGTPKSPYHITKASYCGGLSLSLSLVLRSGRLAIGRLQRNVVQLHRINSFTTCALLCHPQHKHTFRGARIYCFSSRLDCPVQLLCPTPCSLSLALALFLSFSAVAHEEGVLPSLS